MCDVALTLVLYVILRPVGRDLALLAVFFRLVATAAFAATEVFYLAGSLALGGAGYLKTFSADQINTLALLPFRVGGLSGDVFSVLYGVASCLLGYLMYHSGYLPRVLGVLLALGGVGFVVRGFALLLAPELASSLLIIPTAVAGL